MGKMAEENPRRSGGVGIERLRIYFFEKNRWIFRFLTLSSEILDRMKLHPWKNSTKLLHPLKLPEPKVKTFLITIPGNSSSSLIDPWNFHIIFFSIYPQKIPCPQPSPLFGFFSGNSSVAIAILKLSHRIVIWLFGSNSLVHIVFWKTPLEFLDS